MRFLFKISPWLVASLTYFSGGFSLAFATMKGQLATAGDYSAEIFILSGTITILAASYWLARMHEWQTKQRVFFVSQIARIEATLKFYDLLVKGTEKDIAILECNQDTPFFYGDAGELLQQSLEGPAAGKVAKALDQLLNDGRAFDLTVQGTGSLIALKGVPLGRCAVVFFTPSDTADKAGDTASSLAIAAVDVVLDQLSTGVAVFNHDKRLVHYNCAYAHHMQLPDTFLDEKPHQNNILDKQRELRALPERRDFADWKQRQLDIVWSGQSAAPDYWHMRGGRSLSIRTFLLADRGTVSVVEDVSERFSLESRAALFHRMQRATLEAVGDGMAIFGSDGHLVIYNTRFTELWHFHESELQGHPHFRQLANISAERLGQDQIWSIVSAAINAVEPERFGEWSKVMRGDNHEFSLSMSRLPNGDTAFSFSDLTELNEFHEALSTDSKDNEHASA